MSLIHLVTIAGGAVALALASQAPTSIPSSIEPLHVSNRFEFTVGAAQSEVAPLFGAQHERVWADGWDPQFVFPRPAADKAGAVFTIKHGVHTSTWITTVFEPEKGWIQHVYFIPDLMTTLIDIQLRQLDAGKTHVRVTYERTALSPELNDYIRQLGEQDAKSAAHWQKAIQDYLDKSREK